MTLITTFGRSPKEQPQSGHLRSIPSLARSASLRSCKEPVEERAPARPPARPPRRKRTGRFLPLPSQLTSWSEAEVQNFCPPGWLSRGERGCPSVWQWIALQGCRVPLPLSQHQPAPLPAPQAKGEGRSPGLVRLQSASRLLQDWQVNQAAFLVVINVASSACARLSTERKEFCAPRGLQSRQTQGRGETWKQARNATCMLKVILQLFLQEELPMLFRMAHLECPFHILLTAQSCTCLVGSKWGTYS